MSDATDLTEPYIDQFAGPSSCPAGLIPTRSGFSATAAIPRTLSDLQTTVWDNGAGISILRAAG